MRYLPTRESVLVDCEPSRDLKVITLIVSLFCLSSFLSCFLGLEMVRNNPPAWCPSPSCGCLPPARRPLRALRGPAKPIYSQAPAGSCGWDSRNSLLSQCPSLLRTPRSSLLWQTFPNAPAPHSHRDRCAIQDAL